MTSVQIVLDSNVLVSGLRDKTLFVGEERS